MFVVEKNTFLTFTDMDGEPEDLLPVPACRASTEPSKMQEVESDGEESTDESEDLWEDHLPQPVSRGVTEDVFETRTIWDYDQKAIVEPFPQASFIVQPQEGGAENVVGYVAMRPGGNGSAAEPVSTLVELYVEPEFRRRGLATAALKVLLSGCSRVAVGPPAPEVAGDVLRCLGFKAVDARDSLLASCGGGRCDDEDEEHGQMVLFKRRVLKKENQRF
jgi:GNAT superfamily N-acetyltransferase